MKKEIHFSEKGIQILKAAQQNDINFNKEPTTPEEACHNRAYRFWQELDISGLNPYEKRSLGRYAMHSSFEEGVPYQREERVGGEGIMGRAAYSWIRPGWTACDEDISPLAKKFGFSGTDIARWLARHRNPDNWTEKKVVFYTGAYSDRAVHYKTRYWRPFNYCSRTGQNLSSKKQKEWDWWEGWSDELRSLQLKYKEGDKLEVINEARKLAKAHIRESGKHRRKRDKFWKYHQARWHLETAQKFYETAERNLESAKLNGKITFLKKKEKENDSSY